MEEFRIRIWLTLKVEHEELKSFSWIQHSSPKSESHWRKTLEWRQMLLLVLAPPLSSWRFLYTSERWEKGEHIIWCLAVFLPCLTHSVKSWIFVLKLVGFAWWRNLNFRAKIKQFEIFKCFLGTNWILWTKIWFIVPVCLKDKKRFSHVAQIDECNCSSRSAGLSI